MALHESEREVLMREAVALVRRIELHVPGEAEPVVAGFRSDGRLSVFFGGEPVYHFDICGRLRRAFVNGDLYRTQGATLARLVRVRTPQATELRRTDLSRKDLEEFLAAMRSRLFRLEQSLATDVAKRVQQIPPDDFACIDELRFALRGILKNPEALALPFQGRR